MVQVVRHQYDSIICRSDPGLALLQEHDELGGRLPLVDTLHELAGACVADIVGTYTEVVMINYFKKLLCSYQLRKQL